MSSRYIILVQLLAVLHLLRGIASKFEFTNIKCNSLDKEFDDFEYCYLKSVNRSYKYMSLKVNLYKIPITKVKVNFSLLKRFSGYKPFLYNFTVDACKFLSNRKPNPVVTYFHELFRAHSNMNHTCPFDHDIVLDKLSTKFVDQKFTEVLPFPHGDYQLHTSWHAYGINRAEVDIYGTLSHNFEN
ncbi:uncharacterized protein LOC6595060 [Drosophila persimilis]|nr:uncharacterized protein LOC6595060 [Drosophila persimilis]